MYTSIARWYVKEGKLEEATAALVALAQQVHENECETWGYLVHSGGDDSVPPSSANEIVFVEIYKDDPALGKHISGPAFQSFLKESGDLFVSIPGGTSPFFQAQHLDRIAGFVRSEASG